MDRSFRIKHAVIRDILHPILSMHHIIDTKNCFVMLFFQNLTLHMRNPYLVLVP